MKLCHDHDRVSVQKDFNYYLTPHNIMKKTLLPLLVLSICVIILGGSVGIAKPAEAHRSGCHRWHSCPSDTGSYTCGDLGYTSGCPVYAPPIQTYKPPPLSKKSTITTLQSFIEIPKTKNQLYQCLVVGNYNSWIYHLKGSKFIRKMNLKMKKCFMSEQEATDAGFRKSKTR